ncbi:type VII secretion protein EccE [Nocardia sp. NPDC051832]|uniref:type VII secretion protein EccE n=1 Tax=Nocardia sp. NPDC051832 TaxID=3155673 RepID=UPI0034198F65
MNRTGNTEHGVVAATVIGGSVVVVALSGLTVWWVSAIAAAVLLAAATVKINGRTLFRWGADWVEFQVRRPAQARARARTPQVAEVTVAAGVCGIGAADGVLTAMIQLAPDLDLPTVVGDKTVYTEDTVPLALIGDLLDQFGVDIDIDIITTGRRLRAGGGYSMLYDQLIGAQPVVGDRLTWLVLRLHPERNLAVLARRGPVARTAPEALASAAHRIAGRFRERGIAAHALPAVALRDAVRVLHEGVELSALREKWGSLATAVPGRFVTSYVIDWNRLPGTDFDDCWTWNNGRTTVVLNYTGPESGPRALVRFIGPAMADVPGYLRLLGGCQSKALLASLPTGASMPALPAPQAGGAPAELVARMAVAIGPSGQILGAISGQPRHTLALPLFDPAPYQPRRRAVDVHANLPVAQQIILRAMAVGADVEVHTARPDRWRQLVAAVGDPQALRLADPDRQVDGGSAATIVVFDHVPPHSSGAPTTMTINDPGGPRRAAADLAIDQVGAAAVDVSIPMRTVRVDLIEPHGETSYLGGAPQESQAPRAVVPPAVPS